VDVAHAVGTLHDGDSPFRQGAAMPLLERQGFQLHDQSQQPHLKLFRRPGLGGGDGLVVESGQGGGFGGPPRDPIDDPDLVGVQLAAPKRLPHGRHTGGESAAAGDQAAHLIRLVAQYERKLVGHKLTRPDPPSSACTDTGCRVVGNPRIRVGHRRLGESSRRRRGVAARIDHPRPGY